MIDPAGAEDDVSTRPRHRLHGCCLADISDHGRDGKIYLAGLAVLVLMIAWGRYITELIVLLPALTVADPRQPEATNRPRPGVGGRDARLFCCRLDPAAGRSAGDLFHLSVSYHTLPPLMLGAAPGIHRWATVATGFAGALMVMSAALPFDWQLQDGAAIELFLLTGLISVLGHFLLICAYDHAPAWVLANFTYSEIVNATLLGYAIFHDLPGIATWTGGAVIIVSGTFIAHRERKLEETAQTDQEGPKIKLQSARASQSSIFLNLEN